MRRKRLWKQALAVTLTAAMLLGVPSEGVFAVETEFAETTESTEETEMVTEETEDVTEEETVTEMATEAAGDATETEVIDTTEESEDTTENEEVEVVEEEKEKVVTAAGDFQYEENEDGTITVTRYIGENTKVVIPEQIAGKSVTVIGDSAFYCRSDLTSIDIPDSVTIIESGAFTDCTSLTSIEIPDGVTSIEASLFFECKNLVSVKIPDSVTSIGDSAFYLCESLKSIKIPNSVTVIKGGWSFYGCSSMTSIEMSDNVTSIGESAFGGCESLTSIEIPDGVTSIGKYAFNGCMGLTGIEIPDSVTSIEDGAFRGCVGLKSIVVGQGNTEYTSPGNNCIIEKSSNTLLRGCDSTIIPNSVTSIGNYAFSCCTKMVSIKIPNGVTSIGDCAFEGCSSLKSIDIPNSVTSIGCEAFRSCSSLTSIQIPDSVTSIGKYAFELCSNLTSIQIPSSVTSIGQDVFKGCSNLTIYCPDGSTAKQYAIDNKISYQLIGDTDCIHANTELRNAASATCTKVGYTGDTYCKDCGGIVSKGKSIVALGHSYKATVTKQPTVDAEGLKTYTCSRCKASYTEKIAKLIIYTVKFDGNGATSGSVAKQKITYGSKTALNANKFKKKGYSFKNWNTKKDGSGTAYDNKADGSKLTKTNGKTVTLYARWTANKYTVTFNGNGSTSGSMKKLSGCRYGKKYTLTRNGFKKKGYTFTGWNTKKDGSGKTYKNKAEVKNLSSKADGKVTLYAQWKKTKYTITYNLNKGTNNKNNPTSYTITAKTIKLKNPTRKGYTFKGWYSDKKCTKKVTQIKKGSTGNVTLYAKWKKK